MAYTCKVCGRVSHHPEDERRGFCGACCTYQTDLPPEVQARDEEASFMIWLMISAGLFHLKMLPDGRWAGIRQLMTHLAIQCGRVGDREGVTGYWCYHTEAEAVGALEAWTGEGEPEGWYRAPMTGRRRSASADERDGEGRPVGAVGVIYVRY